MNNVQLWALEPGGTNKYKLDLYPTEPIKLTFTAETLTDLPAINSVYSQTFRLPASGVNNQFFQYWFNVNINDFDVSQKVSAEIQTESGLFVEGQLRLQKVYRNYQSTLIDYEVLFLGEVRDFASQIGDGFMNSLNLSGLDHILNYTNITDSWNASPSTTNGLLNGNVLYPLVEYGYEYNAAGQVQDSMIRAEVATTTNKAFSSSLYPLSIYQWRPWVRAKYLVDHIFSLTDYTYESVFFESELFRQLYINATGNTATTSMQDLQVNNLLNVVAADQTYGNVEGVTQKWQWPTEVIDSGNNWNGQSYTAPVSGNYVFEYDFVGDVGWYNVSGGSGAFPDVDINIYYYVNGVPTYLTGANNGSVDPFIFFSDSGNIILTLNAGDVVEFGYVVSHLNGPPPTYIFEATLNSNILQVTLAPISVNVATLLPNNIKVIDWFRALLKKFRLVMVPKRNNPKEFVIEPWNDYISSGTDYDWTHKLDGSKDIQFEPLFYTQSATIKFTDQEDQDHPNFDQQTVFKEVYGTRFYDSNNDLLKDQRVIDTLFAPTPIEVIDGATVGVTNQFILPHFAKIEATSNGGNQLKPVVAKPRLLFYNGLKSAAGIPAGTWYFDDDQDPGTAPIAHTNYPLVSYMSDVPTISTTTNLSWEIEAGRWYNNTPNGLNGQDVYTKYWQAYVDGIYSPEARKMTATFVLDSQDLKADFNDSIFIRDSWWRILKINNAPLDGINAVNVELIKLLDSPNLECDCEQYVVTDNRLVPEGPFSFEYVNCETEEIVTGEVFENSVIVCSCAPIFTGDPAILTSPTGQACSTGPTPTGDVVVDVAVDTSNGGAVLLDQSVDGTTWTNVASRDVPLEPAEFQFPGAIDQGSAFRVGYQQAVGTGDVVDINFLRDGVIISTTTIDATNTMQYAICPEAMNINFNYTVDIAVS